MPVPALTARVIDQTGTLSAAEQQALEAKLATFEQAKGSQIVVLIVPTTQPEDIASFANRVANTWKIGRREVGDGLLIIVAKDDRRMRIEVAKSLEGAIPDIAAARIIDGEMMPRFRTGDFAGGLQAAADRIKVLIENEHLPVPERSPGRAATGQQIDWLGLGLFLFVGVMILGPVLRRILGKTLGPLFTGGLAGGIAFLITASLLLALLAGMIALMMSLFSAAAPMSRRGPIFMPGGYDPFPRGGGWGGSFGGGFGSGGDSFGSGGGGNFGGGGASGSW